MPEMSCRWLVGQLPQKALWLNVRKDLLVVVAGLNCKRHSHSICLTAMSCENCSKCAGHHIAFVFAVLELLETRWTKAFLVLVGRLAFAVLSAPRHDVFEPFFQTRGHVSMQLLFLGI